MFVTVKICHVTQIYCKNNHLVNLVELLILT